MKIQKILYYSLNKLKNLLDQNILSSIDLTKIYFNQIETTNKYLGSFLGFNRKKSFLDALASDKRRKYRIILSHLDGIPIGIKDNIAQKDSLMTCGSRILKNFISPYDAFVIKKIKQAGGILLGRTNLDEFAMGSTNENSYFNSVSNPWNIKYVSGGSSGGSAAAIAAAQVPIAIGSDTGGSIRQPAAFCGVIGLKPTYGTISRYGLASYASSLDQIGIIAKKVIDIATLFEIIIGKDNNDSTSVLRPFSFFKESIDHQKISALGVPKELFNKNINAETKYAIKDVCNFFKKHGIDIIEISLPIYSLATTIYYIIAMSESSSNLSRYDGIRFTRRSIKKTKLFNIFKNSRSEGFGDEIKRRIIIGTDILSNCHYNNLYLNAQKIRTIIWKYFINIFNLKKIDGILLPTTPNGPCIKNIFRKNPMSIYGEDIYTIFANLTGFPSISFPYNLLKNGLPIGIQLIGKAFEEEKLLYLVNLFEKDKGCKNLYNKIYEI